MMTRTELYFSPQPTRAARARWAFIEAGLTFEPHAVDVFKGEHKTEAYLAVNPMGLVPSAIYDGALVVESAALALMAAYDNPERGLLPEPGSLKWRLALQWVVFAPAEFDHLLATLNTHRLFRSPAERNAQLVAETTELFDRRAKRVSDALSTNPFLLGDTFTVADVCVGHSMVWAKMHDLLRSHPMLVDYLERLQARPAFQEVYGPRVEVFPDPFATA